jgi:hypothetical protein
MLPGATGAPTAELAALRMPQGLMAGDPSGAKRRMRLLKSVRDVNVASGVHRESVGLEQLGAGGWTVVAVEAFRPVSGNSGDDAANDFANATIKSLGNKEVSGGVYGYPRRDGTPALAAGPLSPLNVGIPFPATVVMIPLETLRMR